MSTQGVELAWLDARETVTVMELSQACGLSADELHELIEYGALSPLQAGESQVIFSAACVTPMRTVGKLRRDFDLDLFALATVLGYLERIEELERELRTLRAHVPGYGSP